MTQQRTFTLIGNFTDNITPAINTLNRTIASISTTKRGGFSDLTKSIGKVNAAQKHMRDSIKQTVSSLNDYHNALSRVYRGLEAYSKQLGKLRGAQIQMDRSAKQIKDQATAWDQANTALERYLRNQRQVNTRGFGGGPGGPRGGSGGGGGRGGGGGGGRGRPGPLQFAQDFLITNAIVSGFYKGVQIMQNGLNSVFKAFVERTKDQLEDIASAGGIFSAGKFGGAKGLPTTFQGALEMQDNINKQMASVASALPGTTQDFVMNARRMTDTLAQMMSKNTKEFEKLAQKLSGDTQASGEKAFEIINVEVAKATTLLEKLNPTRTTVPMTQIVEDMMKSEKVSIAGLRRYVSFRRATTFEAAMNRNLKELNAAGAGTAERLGAIIKTLKEAVPPELITAMTTSVSGVIEGFKSAIFDPDVGIFGLSRTLSMTVVKFNKETGEIMRDKLGNAIQDTTNFFKMFADIFGNFGNLLNSVILPGIMAIYNPFEAMGASLEDLREYSFHIFKQQQSFTAYYSDLAEKYGMSAQAFKSGEKGGLGVILELLQGFDIISESELQNYLNIMDKKGSAEQIAKDMSDIYKKVIPAFLDSPFISRIFESIGFALGKAVGILADVLGAAAGVNTPSASAFTKAFTEAGGVEAIRRSLEYVIILIGKVLFKVISSYFTAIRESLLGKNQGNIIDRIKNVVTLLLPTLLVPGVRNFVVAVLKGVFRGLSGRAVTQGAAEAAQGAAEAASGTAQGAGANKLRSPTWLMPPSLRRARRRTTVSVGRRLRDIKQTPYRGPIGPTMVPRKVGGKEISYLRPGLTVPGKAQKGISSINKSMSGIQKFGKAAGKVAGGLPLLSAAIAVFDFSARKMSGESTTVAAGGAIGAGVGGLAGGFLGSFLTPFIGPLGPIAGGIVGSVLGDWIGSGIGKLLESIPGLLQTGWMQLETWIKNLPYNLGFAISYSIVKLQAAAVGLYNWVSGLSTSFAVWVEKTLVSIRLKLNNFGRQVSADFQSGALWTKLKDAIVNGFKFMLQQAWNFLNPGSIAGWVANLMGGTENIANRVTQGWRAGAVAAASESPIPAASNTVLGEFLSNTGSGGGVNLGFRNRPEPRWRGGLGDAVASEMRHKPSGSHLVVANSSETVIPAAGGFGMEAFVGYLTATAKNTAASANILTVVRDVLNRVFPVMDNIKSMTSSSLTKSDSMIKTMTSGAMRVRFLIGSGGKGGPGAVDAFNPIAASHGLQLTSHYRPGDKGWHGVDRARDYSNGVNTPQMMDFAQFMVAAFGGDLLELIYTPLGFSIKNGNIVPPIAADTHFDHVHVAYAYGAGRPAFFGSVKDAQAWESKMAPSYASISTVTANSSEGFGGSTMLNAPITIYQQPNQDPEELASLVAMRLSMVIDELRNH